MKSLGLIESAVNVVYQNNQHFGKFLSISVEVLFGRLSKNSVAKFKIMRYVHRSWHIDSPFRN